MNFNSSLPELGSLEYSGRTINQSSAAADAAMVGTAQPTTTGPLQWQQKVSCASSSSVAVGAPAASGEEEARKKNTDCVYFLASPLTCKKVCTVFQIFLVFLLNL